MFLSVFLWLMIVVNAIALMGVVDYVRKEATISGTRFWQLIMSIVVITWAAWLLP